MTYSGHNDFESHPQAASVPLDNCAPEVMNGSACVPLSPGALGQAEADIRQRRASTDDQGERTTLFQRVMRCVADLSAKTPCLVFCADASGLCGAVIRQQGQRCHIVAAAQSRDVDFTRAIADVVGHLKRCQRRLPERAVLLTSSVFSTLIELPVSPLRPRSDAEMQELIHWELEAVLAQQNRQWLIGNLLVERGYLAAASRDQLVQRLQLQQRDDGNTAMLRFGELAMAEGFISAEQFHECLQLQRKLVSEDTEAVYGWKGVLATASADPLCDEALKSRDEDADSAHHWLVSGIAESIRKHWVGAFRLNNLQLQAFYPVTGGSFAALAQPDDAAIAMLEVHPQQFVLLLGRGNRLTAQARVERQPGALLPEHLLPLLDQLPDDVRCLQVAAGHAVVEELQTVLVGWLDIPIEPATQLTPAVRWNGEVAPERLLPLLGAARDTLALLPGPCLSGIRAQGKAAPLWRRFFRLKVLLLLPVVLLLCAMVASLFWIPYETERLSAERQHLRAQLRRDQQVRTEYARVRQQRQALAQQINAVETLLQDYRGLVQQMELSLPRARLAVPGVMKGIVISATDGVQLRRLRRTREVLEIEAWALSDTEGLEFVDTLNQWLKPVGYQVRTSEIFQRNVPAAQERRRRNFSRDQSALPYRIEVILEPFSGQPLALTTEP